MTGPLRRTLLLALALATPAWCQFGFCRVDGEIGSKP
jgi:hypothetical protein